MARKKLPEEHENHERWLVSYADFITLLFAFFVVMYSISSVNEGKYRVLSDALMSAFRQPQKSIKPIQIGKPAKSPVTSRVEFMNEPTVIETPVLVVPRKQPLSEEKDKAPKGNGGGAGAGADTAAIEKIAKGVSEALSELVERGMVRIYKSDLWVEVEIRNSVLFPSASARLQPGAVPVLREVAKILKEFPNPVRVEGFTDNLPINTLLYPSNWELSTARAASVVRLFERLGIGPQRMSALGYGEHRPVASNRTADGRARNRRVVLVVLANRRVEQLLESGILSRRDEAPENRENAGQGPAQVAAGDGRQDPGHAAAQPTPVAGSGRSDDQAPDTTGRVAVRGPSSPAAPSAAPRPAPPETPFFTIIDPPIKFAPPVQLPSLAPSEPVGHAPAIPPVTFRTPKRFDVPQSSVPVEGVEGGE